MEYSAEILTFFLSEDFPVVRKQEQDIAFSAVLLWDGEGTDPGALYLSVSDAPDLPNILFVGKEFAQKQFAVLCAPEEKNRCCNRALQSYAEFRAWSTKLEHLAETESDPEALLDASLDYFGVQADIVDSNFEVKFAARGCADSTPMELADVQRLYISNQKFDTTFQQKGLQCFHREQDAKWTVYYCNLFYEEEYAARLLMRIPTARDCAGMRLLLAFLGKNTERCYKRFYESRLVGRFGARVYDGIRRMLEGEQLAVAERDRLLQDLCWNSKGRFQVLRLVPDAGMDEKTMLNYLCVQLEREFGACVALPFEDGICCVVNLSGEHERQAFLKKRPNVLRDTLCRSGICREFEDFFALPKHFRQAKDALRLGMQRDPSRWFYYFGDLAWDYILESCVREYPPEELFHPAIAVLRAYDAEHPGSELTGTLFEYLKCGQNASQAAEKLYIHRTTFLYRMNRIRALTGFDPGDWRQCLHLMVSLSLSEPLRF